MTVNQLAERLSLKILAGNFSLDNTICSGYCCDLLSWVMSRAKENDAWITVMGNLNSIAVASLTDCACIILAENASLDNDAKQKADSQDISILQSDLPAYELAIKLDKLLNN